MASSCLKMRKSTKEERFLKNGGILLAELIASCDGKCNHIRTFSAKQLNKATDNYDSRQRLFQDVDYILYKGFLENRPISVKKYTVGGRMSGLMGSPFADIAIGSQMNAHKHVLKLIGCCLETEYPILVYEFVGNETLSRYISQHTDDMKRRALSWKWRVTIAVDIANVLAYLHTALPRRIVLRDIRASNIILDEKYVARLTDFSLSICIPDGQLHVEDAVGGRTGYLAPEYAASGYMTQKVDVYGYGMFLLQLLTGRQHVDLESGDRVWLPDHVNHCIEKQQLIEILHPAILREGIEQKELRDLVTLALSCICDDAEDRPKMIDVAKELKRIQQSASPRTLAT